MCTPPPKGYKAKKASKGSSPPVALVKCIVEHSSAELDFFSEYGDASRYKIQEVIGKGSYGVVVCSAIDTHTGEKVAIKKIHDIFEHVSDAARILREIKLDCLYGEHIHVLQNLQRAWLVELDTSKSGLGRK